jgi:DNA (cytosine-5)-methyltransferase 1
MPVGNHEDNPRPLRYGSVCSGIEAATVAWHPLGWRAAWLCELADAPAQILAHHYPGVPNLRDMTLIPGILRGLRKHGRLNELRNLIDIDLLVGGTPCQAFSVAGLRESLSDARGNLTLVFVRIVRLVDAYRHRYCDGKGLDFVVWENVPGVLSTKDNALGSFLAGLVGEDEPLVPGEQAGARWSNAGAVYGPEGAAAWRVLDAQYFGLAQRRKRVFLVRCPRGGADPAKILFELDGVRRDSPPRRQAGAGTARDVASSLRSGGAGTSRVGDTRGQDNVVACVSTGDVSHCLNGGGMGRLDLETETLIAHALKGEGHDASKDGTGRGTPIVPVAIQEDNQNGVTLRNTAGSLRSNAPGTQPCGTLVMVPVAYQCHGSNVGEMGVLRAGNGNETGGVPFVLSREDVAFTIVARGNGTDPAGHAQGWNSNFIGVPRMGVRRLMPVECERLQGFPEGYTLAPVNGEPASDSVRYKALGNSKAIPVVRWLGKRIDEARKSTPAA